MLLATSVVLRVALALQGGQEFIGDEPRYLRGPILLKNLLAGEWDWVRAVVKQPEHAGFTYVVLLVAPFHQALAALGDYGDWSRTENISASLPLAAAVLGLFSTLNLWLIHRLALHGGASQREAGMAALLAAGSNSLFYYSRHLLPYDSSLTLALSGMIFSVSGTTRTRQLLGGVCAGLTYEIYNGYWFLVPVIGWTLLVSQSGWSARFRAGCVWSVGLLATCGLVALPGVIISGPEYWETALRFSRTATQGLFAEGWSLPWAYLWASESWGGAVLAGVALAVVARDAVLGVRPRRVLLWVSAAGVIYFLLVLTSVGLEKFVVYARTARALVPFICLLAAYGLERLLSREPRWRPMVVVSVVLMAGANFAPSFALTYPRETKQAIWQNFGVPKQALSFRGSFYPSPVKNVTRPDLVLVNAQLIYPLGEPIGYPRGRELWSVSHPQNFVPYQYDGLTPRERALLKEHPLFIKLIQVADPSAVPDNPPLDLVHH